MLRGRPPSGHHPGLGTSKTQLVVFEYCNEDNNQNASRSQVLAERQVRLGFAFPSKTDGGGADGLQPPLTLEPTRFYEQLGPHDVGLRDSVRAHSPALVLFPKQALNPPGPTSWSGEPDSPEGPSSAGTESPCKRDLRCRGISSPPWVEKETEARGRKVTCWRSQNSERRLFNHGLWGKPAHPYSAFKIRSFILKPEFLAPRGNRKVLVLMGSGEGWLVLERTGTSGPPRCCRVLSARTQHPPLGHRARPAAAGFWAREPGTMQHLQHRNQRRLLPPAPSRHLPACTAVRHPGPVPELSLPSQRAPPSESERVENAARPRRRSLSLAAGGD